jgi:hypothetical protein
MALTETLIGLNEPLRWQQALNGVPHGYWHTWHACRALHHSHQSPTWLYLCEDTANGGKACCVFAERRWQGETDIFSPAGFSGFVASHPIAGVRERWHKFAAGRGYVCGYFALHPMLAEPQYHNGLSTSNDLYFIDLTLGISTLRDRADRNVKRSLNAWSKSKMSPVEDREVLGEFILRHYRDFMSTKNASPAVLWDTETLKMICGDPDVLMVGARDAEGLCSVLSFAKTRYGAEHQFNINIRKGRHYTAPLMFWGIDRLINLNLPWLNMGGGVKPDDSVAMAKERYRPQRLPFYSAKEIYNTEKYRMLCRKARVNADGRDGYFPKYRMQPIQIGGSQEPNEAPA